MVQEKKKKYTLLGELNVTTEQELYDGSSRGRS